MTCWRFIRLLNDFTYSITSMSTILKEILKPKISAAMKSFGTTEYSGPMDPAKAQEQFIDKLSEVIVSVVQVYLM